MEIGMHRVYDIHKIAQRIAQIEPFNSLTKFDGMIILRRKSNKSSTRQLKVENIFIYGSKI